MKRLPIPSGFSLLHLAVFLFLQQTATVIAPLHLTAQSRSITVTGIVRDASSGDPLVAVTIVHDSLAVAITNEAGLYETSAIVIDGASTSLVFRRIGYASNAQDVAVPAVGTEARVDVTLLPAPTNLERIVVSGERVVVANPGLVGFYERREDGFGRYLTGEEIARIGGIDLTNHLRRLRVRATPPDLRDPFGRPTFSSCIAAYVDGIRLLDLTTINEWVPATSLGGIEVHRPNELSHLPAEFVAAPPPGCGETPTVILFWSKVLREPSPFEFGVLLGALVGGDGGNGRYAGARFVTPLRSGNSTLRLHMDGSVRMAGAGDKWRFVLNVAGKPFGRRSPLYFGTGLGLTKRDNATDRQGGESLAAHHTVVAGLVFDLSFFRPFVEIQVYDPLRPGRIAMMSQVGVRFRYGA